MKKRKSDYLRVVGFCLLLTAILLSACQGAAQQTVSPTLTSALTPAPTSTPAEPVTNYPNGNLLVDTDWLQEHLDDLDLAILDMRSPGDYAMGHIAGAINIPVGDIVAAVDGVPFEFDETLVQETLSSAGLTPDTRVVIYDDLGMMNAARLFWTLEYIGHADVRILNGGWNAWVDAELPTTEEAPDLAVSSYAIELQPDKIIDAQGVLERLEDPNVVIVDARSPQEYTGEVMLAERGGHIPGAVNLPWVETLTGGDTVYTINPDWQTELSDIDVEVFKSAEEIRQILEGMGITQDKEVITYCQTLWRGAHMYFLLRLMGFENVRGYDGSWAEWGNNPDLPVVTGDQPGG